MNSMSPEIVNAAVSIKTEVLESLQKSGISEMDQNYVTQTPQTQQHHHHHDNIQPPETMSMADENNYATPSQPTSTPNITYSQVSGGGLFASWRRNFQSRQLALLDLLDNAVDAAADLNDDRTSEIGCISLESTTNGQINLVNSSLQPIPPIAEVLNVFRSSKEQNKDIGQNGVGIKQACASLAELSWILIRTGKVFSIGIISETLQIPEATPSIVSTVLDDLGDPNAKDLLIQVHALAKHSVEFEHTLTTFGEGDISRGASRLYKRLNAMMKDGWEKYDEVFQVVMFNVIQEGGVTINDDDNKTSYKIKKDANDKFLAEARENFARTYIHLHDRVKVYINSKEPILLKHWELKLLNLTKFPLYINNDMLYMESLTPSADSKEMVAYCGFDAWRKAEERQALHLYIYSRPSGRLIEIHSDARHLLDLTTGSTDYCQGLVMILDDRNGHLPLTPTKQALAFSQTGGNCMERNLFAWLSACCRLYYTIYKRSFHDSKEALSSAVFEARNSASAETLRKEMLPLGQGDWDTISKHISWRRMKEKIYSSKIDPTMLVLGRDTQLRLQRAPISRKSARQRIPKPKAAAVQESNNDNNDDEDVVEAELVSPASKVDETIMPRKKRKTAIKAQELIRNAEAEHDSDAIAVSLSDDEAKPRSKKLSDDEAKPRPKKPTELSTLKSKLKNYEKENLELSKQVHKLERRLRQQERSGPAIVPREMLSQELFLKNKEIERLQLENEQLRKDKDAIRSVLNI